MRRCVETWYGLSHQTELESKHPVKKYKIIQYFLNWQLYLESPVRDLSSCLGDISVPLQLDNKTSFIMVRSSYEINSNNTIR